MTTPFTTEMPQRLEPVTHDPFIDDLCVPAPRPARIAGPLPSPGRVRGAVQHPRPGRVRRLPRPRR
jgi:hypothetical protein